MAEYELNEDGILVDASGNPFEIEADGVKAPVKVRGALTQSKVDRLLAERLERQKRQLESGGSVDRDKLLAEIEQERAKLNEEASKRANAAVQAQMAKLSQERETLAQQLERERKEREHEQIANKLLAKAGDRFINPARDIVPELTRVHRREVAVDANGNKLEGQFVDVFQIDGKNLSAEEALEHYASRDDFAHYVRPKANGGAGGARTTTHGGTKKRSAMTIEEKSAYVADHGEEAFYSLPA